MARNGVAIMHGPRARSPTPRAIAGNDCGWKEETRLFPSALPRGGGWRKENPPDSCQLPPSSPSCSFGRVVRSSYRGCESAGGAFARNESRESAAVERVFAPVFRNPSGPALLSRAREAAVIAVDLRMRRTSRQLHYDREMKFTCRISSSQCHIN